MPPYRLIVACFTVLLILFTLPADAQAQGHPHLPVAFRTWPNQTISIETYWGFTVALGPDADKVPGIDEPDKTMGAAGLAVVLTQDADEATVDWDAERSFGLGKMKEGQTLGLLLDRQPNESVARLSPEGDRSPNAAWIGVWPYRKHGLIGRIDADGITVVYGSLDVLQAASSNTRDVIGEVRSTDVLVITSKADIKEITAKQIKDLARDFRAAAICIAGDTKVTGEIKTRKAVGNTTALIAGEKLGEDGPVLIQHADKPRQMPQEMAALYDDLDATSRKYTPVFEPLSVKQMNHKPANGTHTPRWNIEHMASRQMYFITAAYHAADARFPHVQLDPKQMPPDYVAKHPDWNGAEEARRVYRTTAFLRRFAYLYHDRDLNAPIAEGSRIRFAPIMRQVTRHWGLHTPNVQDKMKLADWPAE